VPLCRGAEAEAIVLCDDAGFDFFAGMNIALNAILRRLDKGAPLSLILANPDLIYPTSENEMWLTAGSMAVMLEAALQARFPGAVLPSFVPLGKPHRPIFEKAAKLSGGGAMVMIGDQLLTDVKGAIDFGIDSVLVGYGVTALSAAEAAGPLKPTYLLPSLAL